MAIAGLHCIHGAGVCKPKVEAREDAEWHAAKARHNVIVANKDTANPGKVA